VTYCLADMKVAPCRACDVCHKTGRCAIEDDFAILRQAMLDADAIALASPNYILSVTAQMKAFFDRCCGLLHLQALEGKYAAAAVTSGGAGYEEVERYTLRFLRSLGCWTVGSVGTEASRLSDDAAAAPVLRSAAALGTQLVAATEAGQPMPEQQVEREAFYQRMKDLMVRQQERWPYEHECWKARGRL